MGLLADALEAGGGLRSWKRLSRITAHLSIKGEFLSKIGKAGPLLSELVAEGSIRTQSIQLIGFPDPRSICTCQPDRVAIDNQNGTRIRSRGFPHLRLQTNSLSWDDLDLAYFLSLALWDNLAAPFRLTLPDVENEELSTTYEDGEPRRRLAVVLPSSIASCSPRQIFHFDSTGLRRKLEYKMTINQESVRVAVHLSAHQRFSGIVIPTLLRFAMLQLDRPLREGSSCLDIEIFDASFR